MKILKYKTGIDVSSSAVHVDGVTHAEIVWDANNIEQAELLEHQGKLLLCSLTASNAYALDMSTGVGRLNGRMYSSLRLRCAVTRKWYTTFISKNTLMIQKEIKTSKPCWVDAQQGERITIRHVEGEAFDGTIVYEETRNICVRLEGGVVVSFNMTKDICSDDVVIKSLQSSCGQYHLTFKASI